MRNNRVVFAINIIGIAICLLVVFVVIVGSVLVRIDERKENAITNQIKAELILQATDDGEDGDEYVVFLFPALASYTEETDGKGKYYLALIVGSGTDDDGEWMFVEYYNGEIMTYHYRIVDFLQRVRG